MDAGGSVEEDLQDPCPDIHELFLYYNVKYFGGALDSVAVQWSRRMTCLCAAQECAHAHTLSFTLSLTHTNTHRHTHSLSLFFWCHHPPWMYLHMGGRTLSHKNTHQCTTRWDRDLHPYVSKFLLFSPLG